MLFKSLRRAGKTSTPAKESSVHSTNINGAKDKNISPSNINKKNTISDPSVKKSIVQMNTPDSSKKRKISSNKNLSGKESSLNGSIKVSPSVPKKSKINDNHVDENHKSSIAIGEESLKWMISPNKTKKFINQYFEKNVLHIQRNDKDYYKSIFSCKAFDKLLRNSDKPLIYGKVRIIKMT